MFKKNDLIVVSGFKITDNGKLPSARIAVVVDVGLYDLIVELTDDFLKRHIILSKSVCLKIPDYKLKMPKPRPIPSIGDLVVHYNFRFREPPVKTVGHVVEIEFGCCGESWVYLLKNNKLEKFNLDQVIILEKSTSN